MRSARSIFRPRMYLTCAGGTQRAVQDRQDMEGNSSSAPGHKLQRATRLAGGWRTGQLLQLLLGGALLLGWALQHTREQQLGAAIPPTTHSRTYQPVPPPTCPTRTPTCESAMRMAAPVMKPLTWAWLRKLVTQPAG